MEEIFDLLIKSRGNLLEVVAVGSLDVMDATADLTPWDIPFAKARDPSVSLITEQSNGMGGDIATIIVAPHGLDQYPKYLVRFDKVIVALCYEEALDLSRAYPEFPKAASSVCAYLWPDSPWLRASRGWAEFLQWPDLQHYIIFGGDSIVELLASSPSNVDRIDERRVLEMKYEV